MSGQEEEHILIELERLEDEIDNLPWRAFVQRRRKRAAMKRWRRALASLHGESHVERRVSLLGRLLGAILKS